MVGPWALDDVRVLDLSEGIAGPLAARLIGDFGADVIKVEPPHGESGRRTPPFFQDDPDPEKSLFYLMLNLNKRGITLNLDTEEGAAILRRLASEVDVIVESFSPGYLAARGLDYASLAQENPGLVMTSITPFGQTGPYSHYKSDEIIAYATSGIMAISGTVDREPLKHGGFPGQYEAGMNGFLGTLVALVTRDLTGAGQQVDLSIQDVITSSLVLNQPYYSFAGGVQGRRHPEGSNFGQVMPCKDGYFVAQPGGGVTWDGIADFFGKPELKEHRFADLVERVHHGPELDAIILAATKDRTMAEMFKTASEKYRMLLGIVQTPEDLAKCEHLMARGYFEEVEHPVIGKIKVPFHLWKMSASNSTYRRPAPLLGQHNGEIYGALLACDAAALDALRARGVI
ncbi:MAG: CoA transferase [Acetobacteraceae bacterium]|jgi:crotonobetainyl-CoA:carnitine CoA-transferase CaiB-like acyl-CoA transferase